MSPVPGCARISLDLPVDIVARLAAQVQCTDMSRAFLIETAVLGLLHDFEQIDAEEGRPCTCGSPSAHTRDCPYLPKLVAP